MKTNYGLWFLDLVISVLMLLSLNAFTTCEAYLPGLFLYFISNVTVFIDKITYYKETKCFLEKWASISCFLVSVAMVCLYICNSLGFVKISFQCADGVYHMLLQGIPNSFFTFESVDITYVTFICAVLIPAVQFMFGTLTYMREKGFPPYRIVKIIKANKLKTFMAVCTFALAGGVGAIICRCKYLNKYEGYGEAQYVKYFLVFFVGALAFFMIFFINFNKESKE